MIWPQNSLHQCFIFLMLYIQPIDIIYQVFRFFFFFFVLFQSFKPIGNHIMRNANIWRNYSWGCINTRLSSAIGMDKSSMVHHHDEQGILTIPFQPKFRFMLNSNFQYLTIHFLQGMCIIHFIKSYFTTLLRI